MSPWRVVQSIGAILTWVVSYLLILYLVTPIIEWTWELFETETPGLFTLLIRALLLSYLSAFASKEICEHFFPYILSRFVAAGFAAFILIFGIFLASLVPDVPFKEALLAGYFPTLIMLLPPLVIAIKTYKEHTKISFINDYIEPSFIDEDIGIKQTPQSADEDIDIKQTSPIYKNSWNIGHGTLVHQEVAPILDTINIYLSQFGSKKPETITLNPYEWALLDLSLRQANGNSGGLHNYTYNDLIVHCMSGRCYCHHFLDDPEIREIVKTLNTYLEAMGGKKITSISVEPNSKQKLNNRFKYFFNEAFDLDTKPDLAIQIIRVTAQELNKPDFYEKSKM